MESVKTTLRSFYKSVIVLLVIVWILLILSVLIVQVKTDKIRAKVIYLHILASPFCGIFFNAHTGETGP